LVVGLGPSARWAAGLLGRWAAGRLLSPDAKASGGVGSAGEPRAAVPSDLWPL